MTVVHILYLNLRLVNTNLVLYKVHKHYVSYKIQYWKKSTIFSAKMKIKFCKTSFELLECGFNFGE